MKELTKEQELEIIRLYTEERRGQLYCAKQVVGLSNPKYTTEVLHKYNISVRNQSEAAKLSNKNREKHKNKDYFKNPNPNMAWLMGFIAADGTVRKNSNEIKIGLSIKDREILEKIKDELELETDVKDYTTAEGFDCCTLRWTCEEHKKDLAKYSIIPQKTFLLKPPWKLPQEYWIDYIRGYFDGDGSINLIQNKNLRWQVCSATKEIIEWIINELNRLGIPPVKVQEQKRTNCLLYYCQYSTNSTKKIFNILYTPNSLRLERKYLHFKAIL